MSGATHIPLLVIGEAIADFVPQSGGDGLYRLVTGGSGFNTTLAAARLGLQARFAWSLSTDALGQRFRVALAQEGADMSLVRASDRPTPVAIVRGAGEAGPLFALHLAMTAHDEPPDLPVTLAAGAHVHVASFAGTVGQAADECLALLAAAKMRGASSYDPNIRPACLPAREAAQGLIEARVAASAIARASDEDLGWLYPSLAPHEVLERWRTLGADIAIVTRGAAGALALGPAGLVEVPAHRVTVKDTVGAGDAFSAGFLSAMAAEGALAAGPLAPSTEALVRWLTRAAHVAALTCARDGCDPPRAADLTLAQP
jgi:fructokinase